MERSEVKSARHIVCRLKQWLNIAGLYGDFTGFEAIKRAESVEEILAGVEGSRFVSGGMKPPSRVTVLRTPERTAPEGRSANAGEFIGPCTRIEGELNHVDDYAFGRFVFAAPVLLMGAGLRAAPTMLTPPAPWQGTIYRGVRFPPSLPVQHNWMSFGDVIPPCDMVFGYTNQGPTDKDGHLLRGLATALPHWTFTTAPPKTQRR